MSGQVSGAGGGGESTPGLSILPDAAALVTAGTLYDPTAVSVAKRTRGVDNVVAADGAAGVPFGVSLTTETSLEVDVRTISSATGGYQQVAPIMVRGATNTLFAGWAPQFGVCRASYANAGGAYNGDITYGTGLGTAGSESPRLWRTRIAAGIWYLDVGREDGAGGIQYDTVLSATYTDLGLGTFVSFGVGGMRAKCSIIVAGARAPAAA